jgi:hypothetical protein
VSQDGITPAPILVIGAFFMHECIHAYKNVYLYTFLGGSRDLREQVMESKGTQLIVTAYLRTRTTGENKPRSEMVGALLFRCHAHHLTL